MKARVQSDLMALMLATRSRLLSINQDIRIMTGLGRKKTTVYQDLIKARKATDRILNRSKILSSKLNQNQEYLVLIRDEVNDLRRQYLTAQIPDITGVKQETLGTTRPIY